MPRPSRITLATVRRLALTFPGVEEGLSYPTVLVRLGRVTEADLRDVLEQAWRLHAPRRLVTEYDRADGRR